MTRGLKNKVIQEHLEKLLNDFQTVEDYNIVYEYINKYGKKGFPVYKSLIKLNRKMDLLETFSKN